MEDFLFRRVKPSYHPDDLPSVVRNGIYMVRLLKSDCAILFFHGAGSDIGYNYERIINFRQAGYSVYIPEYPGFGHNRSKPSFDGCCQAGLATYQQAVEDGHRSIILLGYSLGSVPACFIAGRYEHRLLVLISAFPSILDVAEKIVTSKLAHKICKKFDWNNIHHLTTHRSNLLVIHGEHDKIVPVQFAHQLFETAGTTGRKKLNIQNNGHNFQKWDVRIIPEISVFLAEIERDPRPPASGESSVLPVCP